MAKKDRVEESSTTATGYAPPRVPTPPSNGVHTASVERTVPADHSGWLIGMGLAAAAIVVLVLISLPGGMPEADPSKNAPAVAAPVDEVGRLSAAFQQLFAPSGHSLPVMLGKLLLAALLGAIVGYRQRSHVGDYIVQAHVIIGFTGAMMMIIIGNEIVRAVGLLGAGSIIRYRTPVRDPKALASLFVAMGLGIAVGVGLYDLALIGTAVLVLLQGLPGKFANLLPATVYHPQRAYTMELTTDDAGRTMLRLKDEFRTQDVQYRLLEYDARAKKDGLVKIVMSIEAPATMTTEHLALLVVKDGVQSVSLEEEDVS
jgi:uncharacterized membrane protein YhiD involved in acid resistance